MYIPEELLFLPQAFGLGGPLETLRNYITVYYWNCYGLSNQMLLEKNPVPDAR